MRLNNYSYNYKFPKLTLKILCNYILGSTAIMQLAATKQLA